MRIFSGIQPTGAKHLGNYSGGFRQYAATQERGEAFFCIVDLHSITVAYDPEDLRERTLDLAAMLFATGLDPDRSTVFIQSHVAAHPEAAWLLERGHELRRAPPDDAVQGQVRAAGVRQRRDLHLPGPDGRRHPALPDRPGADRRRPAPAPRARAEHRRALQPRYGETFTLPEGVYPEIGARIMDLQEPERKMSTTGGTPQGDRPPPRRARHDPEEVQERGHGFRAGRAPGRGQAGHHEPDRHPLGRDRRGRPRRSRRATTAAGTGTSSRTWARRSSSSSPRSRSGTRSSARIPRELERLLARGAEKAGRPPSRRSRRCTTGWAS